MKVLLCLSILALSFQTSWQTPSKHGLFKTQKAPADMCGNCLAFTHEFLQSMLDLTQAGLGEGCSEMCHILAEKTNASKAVEVACNLVCDFAGFEAVAKLLDEVDLDEIYYCELLNVCPIKDNGDATIVALNVTPRNVPQGDMLNISMTYKTVNGTGTGMIVLYVDAPDHMPLYDGEINEAQSPGTYSVYWTAVAKPDPDCTFPCETWQTGNYTAHVEVCNGQCGSKHPHSAYYDKKSTTFNVV